MIWENRETIPVDFSTMRACQIPRCMRCGRVARPNVLMFGDWSWVSDRTDRQYGKFQDFVERVCAEPLVVLELGAGTTIPTIRNLSESLSRKRRTTVIRINTRESHIVKPHISMSCGALEGLREIEVVLKSMASS